MKANYSSFKRAPLRFLHMAKSKMHGPELIRTQEIQPRPGISHRLETLFRPGTLHSPETPHRRGFLSSQQLLRPQRHPPLDHQPNQDHPPNPEHQPPPEVFPHPEVQSPSTPRSTTSTSTFPPAPPADRYLLNLPCPPYQPAALSRASGLHPQPTPPGP